MALTLAQVVATSAAVAAASKRTEKVSLLADLLGRCPSDEQAALIGMLTASPRQGRIGVGWATLANSSSSAAAARSSLTLAEADRVFAELATMSGPGSVAERHARLDALLAAATAEERNFIYGVLMGDVRQGAGAGLLTEAVARSTGRSASAVRRAAMLLGDLGRAAELASADELDAVQMTVFTAVQPMLAATSTSVDEALEHTGPASLEWKLDGARVQVHRRGTEVRVYTRSLRDITRAVPGVVSAASQIECDDFILDGEALGLTEDGEPRAFQDSMSSDATLQPFFFDALRLAGEDLIDMPLSRRRALLRASAPPGLLIPSIDVDPSVAADRERAAEFSAAALRAGHEGVMVKALNSVYAAGRRGSTWRKVKPVITVDLAVLAVERGHGRRSAWLSNLHLGARGAHGELVMVGKTFKGLTDELLRWQTLELQRIALGEMERGYIQHVQPLLVVEIAIDGVQRSSRYPGGVALRFARVRRYRPDKTVAEIDTVQRLRQLLVATGDGDDEGSG